MEMFKIDSLPISYFIDKTAGRDWALFLHAAFVDHRMFEKQFEFFSGKYNIIAVDILGHGKSISCKKGDSIEKMAHYLNEIFEKEGIKAAHVVGVSLGSVFAQDFAKKHSEKVLSLACFGGYDISNFDKQAQKENSKAQMSMVFKAFVSIKWFAKANKKISAHTAEAQEEFYRLNLSFKKKSLMHLANLGKVIKNAPKDEIRCPLLVGCGEQDFPLEKEIVKDWAKKSNCQQLILEGAGHCLNMDKPNEFNRAIEGFWKGASVEK